MTNADDKPHLEIEETDDEYQIDVVHRTGPLTNCRPLQGELPGRDI